MNKRLFPAAVLGLAASIFLATPPAAVAQTPGRVDLGFNPGTGADNTVYAIYVQPDGKAIIGGDFLSYNGSPRPRLARVTANGQLDPAFNTGAGPDGDVLAVAPTPAGGVYIGGIFSHVDSVPVRLIARLDANGNLDPTFGTGLTAAGDVYCLAVQPDGKIVAGGFFTTVSVGDTDVSRQHLARFNTDGSLDTTFDPGAGTDASVDAIAVDAAGRIIVGGEFTQAGGVARGHVARFNTDGSLDTTFNPPGGADDDVAKIVVGADGRIYVGGGFVHFNGADAGNLACLADNGSLLDGFAVAGGGDGSVRALALDAAGNVLIGGSFNHYNGNSRNNAARLFPNGFTDETFAPGSFSDGPDGAIEAIAPLGADVLIGGSFTNVDGVSRDAISLLIGSPAVVNITATGATAVEGGEPGVFTLTRTGGDPAQGLKASYAIKGSATNGVDYVMAAGKPLVGFVKFKPRKTSAQVQIVARIDGLKEGTEKVKLKLKPDPSGVYLIGPSNQASVKIVDTD